MSFKNTKTYILLVYRISSSPHQMAFAFRIISKYLKKRSNCNLVISY